MHMHDFLNCFRILLNNLNSPIFPCSLVPHADNCSLQLEYSIAVARQQPTDAPLENGALWIKTLWYDAYSRWKTPEVQCDLGLHHCPPQTYFHILYVEE